MDVHWLLCDELWNWPMNWLKLYALALAAVRSGDAIIANAAAIAAKAKMDFVFIVTCLSTKGDINFILSLNPKTIQNTVEKV